MAPSPPVVALRGAALGFGAQPLFEDITLALAPGDHACLVGRNGSGKSTLLKALAGQLDLDRGERFLQPGTNAAYLPQDPAFDRDGRVADYVSAGLGAAAAEGSYMVDATLQHLGLDPGRSLGTLSGGEGRRVALARTLVSAPDVLLLDEPTNHLDLPTIEWLEAELAQFPGVLLVVSHDRAFLTNVSRIVLWLDRGELHRLDGSFARFEEWAQQIYEREARDRHRLDRQIAREERWLQRGVTARRRRNQGRLARLRELRRQRAEWVRAPGTPRLGAAATAAGGDLVIEAREISKAFTATGGGVTPIVSTFSTRIRRGDRIGIVGPNGAGKTTLVRLLIGAVPPDAGTVRVAATADPLYFDQQRESLDPEATLWQTLVPGGGDALMVRGEQRHVVAYLRDFLFEEWQVHQPVKSLSGGEKNRLLLARLFARPSNLIVLDEPTNDLDLETLDLLMEVLDEYQGTLLLVSHDRDFLDRLVSGIIAVEGQGRVREYVGGYADYVTQRDSPTRPESPKPGGASQRSRQKAERAPRPGSPRKLSYRDQRELEGLPAEIQRLESEVRSLERKLADPDLFRRDPGEFQSLADHLEAARTRLVAAEQRWLELEEVNEQLTGAGAAR